MKRAYEALMREYLRYFPCVAVVGPRQCGKTTLLKTLGSDWQIFDLEKGGDFERITSDPDLFLRLHPKRVAFDEAQQLPGLFPALRVAIDNDRKKKGRFVITGSSSPLLLKSITESLAGRVGVIEMSPFSYQEVTASFKRENACLFLTQRKLKPHSWLKRLQPKGDLKELHQFWLYGGYPEPWLEHRERFHRVWMDNYVTSYLYRDLKRHFPGIDEVRFRKFLMMLATLSGQIINYSEVARSLDVSQPTIKDYFSIAHHTFLWRSLSPYERDVKKRIIKHPRGHMRDSGLLNHLIRITTRDLLLSHHNVGRLWEAFVTEEILRGFNAVGASFEPYFFRTQAGAEIDLLLDGDFGLIPIEIKYGQTVLRKELRTLIEFVDTHACDVGLVINNAETPCQYTEKIFGIPFLYL